MNGFFERLTLGRRLALFGLLGIALVAAPLTMFLSQSAKEIGVARLEHAGLQPANQLLKVIQFVQQHRGMSANVLGGNHGMEGQRAAKQVEVDKAVDELAAALKKAENAEGLVSASAKAGGEWKSLARDVGARAIPGKESYARHTNLVGAYLEVLDLLADHFGLSLDPEADGYHMIMAVLFHMPRLAESLGQGRARGSLHLAQKKISAEERVALMSLVGTTGVNLQEMKRSLGKALEANPTLKASLGAASGEASALTEKAMRLTREQIVEADSLTFDSGEYFGIYTQVIDAQFKLLGVASGELGRILDGRINRLVTAQATTLGVIALVIALSVWVGVMIARSILRQLGGEPAYAAEVVGKVASGDLTVRIETKANDKSSLLYAMKTMVGSLTGTVRGIKESTDTINTAAKEISQGNADLSQRTEEQASSLEETASSMEELTSTVKQNAENARQANQLAVGASDVAVRGGEVVKQVVSTMNGISESSKKIADIIGVIDGIAFQTNILALNAAVEAARAGEQGRGFAVVATEVRNLAQRSAAAAKEIKELITDSVGKVDAGSKLVDEAGKTMDEIVSSVKRVTDIMAEITAASQEQSSGIEQVNTAVTQMDEVTQQNAALVEQAAAAAESMEEQARNLAQMVAQFQLEQGAAAAPAVAASPAVVVSAPKPVVKNVAKFERKLKPKAAAPVAANEAPKAKKAVGAEDDWKEF
jgi:methyl-accepting chemotaxis protein